LSALPIKVWNTITICVRRGGVRQVANVDYRRTFIDVMAQVFQRNRKGLTQRYHYARWGALLTSEYDRMSCINSPKR
jgi:hypothetical protein